MTWSSYADILRRRWPIVAAILLLDVLVSGALFARAYRHVGYAGCVTVYVADVSAPSVTLETTDQLLAGETAANFFGDDILDVAQSSDVARTISDALGPAHLPNSAPGELAVSGARKDRTVNLCVANPSAATAGAAAQLLGYEMTKNRAHFIGKKMARRTYVRVISPASVGKVSASHQLVNLVLRLVLGLLVALGLALLWDAVDPTVRDRLDVERALGVPVLGQATSR